MTDRRVVVTGMGVISPIGLNIEEFNHSLKLGRIGEGPITVFPTEGFPVKRAFEVKGFDPQHHRVHLMDPFIQYAVAAASEALEDARFDPAEADPYRVGISVSSSKGGVRTIERFKDRLRQNPSAILGARIYANAVPNFAAQWIARRWKLKGPAKCYVAACATGTVAVIEGARMISEGIVDYCIAGASDASLSPLMLAGYHNMKVLSRDSMRPYDKRRQGFLVGEGAGILILESLESARARGVKIYGEVIGFGYGSDSYDSVHFSPDDHALSRTLEVLMRRSRCSIQEIDYVNLHGTATAVGDRYETQEMHHALGKETERIPMSSIKSMTGHMLGASGAVEIIACLLAMKDGYFPPTAGLEESDTDCDLDYVPGVSRRGKIQTAISVSMGFGGHIATIALRKVD